VQVMNAVVADPGNGAVLNGHATKPGQNILQGLGHLEGVVSQHAVVRHGNAEAAQGKVSTTTIGIAQQYFVNVAERCNAANDV